MNNYNEHVDFIAGTITETYYAGTPRYTAIVTDDLEVGHAFVHDVIESLMADTNNIHHNQPAVNRIASNVYRVGSTLLKIVLPEEREQLLDSRYVDVLIDDKISSKRYNQVSFYIERSDNIFYFDSDASRQQIKDKNLVYFQ